MELETYIITVQWGAGYRYIVDTFSDGNAIEPSLKYHRERVKSIKSATKKGAKPVVKAWKQLGDL